MKVGFIGHRTVKYKEMIELKLIKKINTLIDIGVNEFVFGSNSEFDNICYHIIENYNKKITIFCCGKENRRYDKIFYTNVPFENRKNIYIERNKSLIDYCDIIIFYFDDQYSFPKTNSGTRIAYEYALRKRKQVFNIFR